MLGIMVLVFMLAVALGLWRRFGAVQWIWLLAGTSFVMIVLWTLLIIFFIGPEMKRMGPPGG